MKAKIYIHRKENITERIMITLEDTDGSIETITPEQLTINTYQDLDFLKQVEYKVNKLTEKDIKKIKKIAIDKLITKT